MNNLCNECPCEADEEHCSPIAEYQILDLINRLQAQNERDVKVKVEALYKVNDLKLEIERLKQNLEEAHIDIREQLAEKENLRCVIEDLSNNTEHAKSEAIKAFAERLKSSLTEYPDYDFAEIVTSRQIDNLVKEMVGEET